MINAPTKTTIHPTTSIAGDKTHTQPMDPKGGIPISFKITIIPLRIKKILAIRILIFVQFTGSFPLDPLGGLLVNSKLLPALF